MTGGQIARVWPLSRLSMQTGSDEHHWAEQVSNISVNRSRNSLLALFFASSSVEDGRIMMRTHPVSGILFGAIQGLFI
jgi:hypothetical protein